MMSQIPGLPTAASLYNEPKNPKKKYLIIIGVLGFIAAILVILVAVAYSEANTATTTLNDKVAAATKAARADQKKIDDLAATKAAESPYRTITVPKEFGAFSIKAPKNWSALVDYELSSTTQVDMYLHPDIITKRDNVFTPIGMHINFIQETLSNFVQQYTNQEGVKQADYTVSGIKGKELTGAFADTVTKRIVVIPVRDKLLVFTNTDAAYDSEFSRIIAETIVSP